jgi:prepilin-type processing-associated H-X9-DG protein
MVRGVILDLAPGHESTSLLVSPEGWLTGLTENLVMASGSSTKLNHAGGANAAFVDGSVRFLQSGTPAAERRALISIAGNDK